jgi:hypothetical protein
MFIIGFIGMFMPFIGIPIELIGICIAGIMVVRPFPARLLRPTARSAHSAVLSTTDLMPQSYAGRPRAAMPKRAATAH